MSSNGARPGQQTDNLPASSQPTKGGPLAHLLVGAGWDALEAYRCSSETIFDNLAAGPAREAGPVQTSLSGLLKRPRKRERINARAFLGRGPRSKDDR
jgi:hypothetical protein